MKATALTLGFCVCALLTQAQDTLTIHGQIVGRKEGTVYLYASRTLGQPTQLVDSVTLTSQFFRFKKVSREPAGYSLSLNEVPGQCYFIWDRNVVASLNADDLTQSTVEESPTTEAWNRFVDTVEVAYERKLREKRETIYNAREQKDTLRMPRLYLENRMLDYQYRNARTSFIKQHKEAWISLFVLVAHHRDLGRKDTLSLLAILSQSLQRSELGNQLRTIVTNSSYFIMP